MALARKSGVYGFKVLVPGVLCIFVFASSAAEPQYLDFVGNESHNLSPTNSSGPHLTEHIQTFRRARRFVDERPEPTGSKAISSYVEVLTVVDNSVYENKSESMRKVHRYCKEIANKVNGIFAPLDIFIALVDVVVWTDKDELHVKSNFDATRKFAEYRWETLNADHPSDLAILLTHSAANPKSARSFDHSLCGNVSSTIVSIAELNTNGVSNLIAWSVARHFGIEEDFPDCGGDGKEYIMTRPIPLKNIGRWSKCSIDQWNSVVYKGIFSCANNKPIRLFGSPTCGNGFVEEGEECDCGLPEHCANPCCHARTCKLRTNAICATGKCCDLRTCQPHSTRRICRPSTGECDQFERCDGETEFCPPDTFKLNGFSCKGGRAYCYNGACRTRDDQCKLLWGPSAESPDLCRNGKDKLGNDDVCGRLQCAHCSDSFLDAFRWSGYSVISEHRVEEGQVEFICRDIVFNPNSGVADAGLAPNGSKCGENKMCSNGTCISIF